jgi:hypothetical protein
LQSTRQGGEQQPRHTEPSRPKAEQGLFTELLGGGKPKKGYVILDLFYNLQVGPLPVFKDSLVALLPNTPPAKENDSCVAALVVPGTCAGDRRQPIRSPFGMEQ